MCWASMVFMFALNSSVIIVFFSRRIGIFMKRRSCKLCIILPNFVETIGKPIIKTLTQKRPAEAAETKASKPTKRLSTGTRIKDITLKSDSIDGSMAFSPTELVLIHRVEIVMVGIIKTAGLTKTENSTAVTVMTESTARIVDSDILMILRNI